MPTLIKQFTFVADTNIAPNQVNANFDDIVAFVNNNLIHKDGTRAMEAHLSLLAADPTTDNQAARKIYVDNKASAAQTAATGVANTAQTAANNAQSSANTALDRVPNKIRWGVVSGAATNAAGDIVFAHTLGSNPVSVVLTPFSSGVTVAWHPVVENKDGANVNVRIYRTDVGGVFANTGGFSFFWFAGA